MIKLDIARIVNEYDVILKFMPLGKVRASTKKHSDHYIVLVNDSLNGEAVERAVSHELLHIILGHLDEAIDLPEIVKERQVAAMMLTFGLIPGRR